MTRIFRFFSVFSIFSIFGCLYLLLQNKNECYFVENSNVFPEPEDKILFKSVAKYEHNLAIIVPFRDRFDELLEFGPHITKFLRKQNISHHIFIVNQRDSFRFNRAALINVGFMFTESNFDYIAMHDVDLLPLNDDLKYSYPKNGPLHVSSPKLHPKYHYEKYIGGILLVSREHYRLVNGMSNQYWGWGLEDDEFYVRLKDAELTVHRHEGIQTGTDNTFAHNHDKRRRRRDMEKCFNQKEVTRKRDRKTGLNTTAYRIEKVYDLKIDGISITVLNVLLECDKSATPWCDCSNASK
ncbi:B4GALT7 family protein [Megaselia abdita]